MRELEKELENKSPNEEVVTTGQQNDESVYNIFAEVDGPAKPNATSTLSAKQPQGDSPSVDDQKNLENKEGMQSLHPAKIGDGAAGSDGWNDWDTRKMDEHKKTEKEEKEENGGTESVAPPVVHVLSLSGERIETGSATKEDQPERNPTAQLFLDIVPHIGTVTTLVSKPRHDETASVQTQAEDTAKTLLLTWMGMDLDFVFEDDGDSDPRNLAGGHQPHAEIKDTYSHNYSHTTPSRLSQYQTYAPNTWLPQHQLYNQHQLYLTPALSYLYPQYPSYFSTLQWPPDTYQQQQQPTPPAPAPAPVRPSPASFSPGQMGSPTASETADNDIVHMIETESEDQDLAKSTKNELHESDQHLEHWTKEGQTEPGLQTAAKVEVVILNAAVGRSGDLPYDSGHPTDVCL